MATLTKGKTFTSGETVTPTKLHELVDLGTVTNIVDADISASAAIALSKLATGALPTAITTTTANIVDASVTPAKLSQPPTFATAQASTSGTSIDFTGIPSWARRITVMFSAVSTTGGANLLIQLGDSGGVETSGYASSSGLMYSNIAATTGSSAGFNINANSSNHASSGHMFITNVGGNTWVASGCVTLAEVNNGTVYFGGTKTLSATLDRVRVTTANGTDTFDAGTINIAYE